MTDRQLIFLLTETVVLCVLAFLGWAAWRGWDPGLCDAYASCEWRRG